MIYSYSLIANSFYRNAQEISGSQVFLNNAPQQVVGVGEILVGHEFGVTDVHACQRDSLHIVDLERAQCIPIIAKSFL